MALYGFILFLFVSGLVFAQGPRSVRVKTDPLIESLSGMHFYDTAAYHMGWDLPWPNQADRDCKEPEGHGETTPKIVWWPERPGKPTLRLFEGPRGPENHP